MHCAREQSRVMSLAEAITNTIIGFILAVGVQLLLFPLLPRCFDTRQHRRGGCVHGGIGAAQLCPATAVRSAPDEGLLLGRAKPPLIRWLV
jgi:hypothetical protein